MNFGEFVPVTISGEVFNDPTDSGTFVSGDTGLSGWTVELVAGLDRSCRPRPARAARTRSATSGPGATPSRSFRKRAGSRPTRRSPLRRPAGPNITGEDLGEFQVSTISGQVFNDVAGSGTYASGDPGLSGWTIDLLNSANTVVASAQTDANGNYTLTGVVPGTYTLEEVPQSGYVQTTAPASYSVTVVPGENPTGLNFGDFQLATVSGEVFNDLNDSGVLNANDPGLSGWTVELLNSSNQVIASDTTNSNGLYSFSNVGPGTYTIEDVLQAGYIQTAPASGSFSITTSSGGTVLGRGLRRLPWPSKARRSIP